MVCQFSKISGPAIEKVDLRIQVVVPVKKEKENNYNSYIENYSLHNMPLFRNKRFALNEMFQRNASKFSIFYV